MPVKERSAVLADGNPHEIPPVWVLYSL
jgi:hypothetical protein